MLHAGLGALGISIPNFMHLRASGAAKHSSLSGFGKAERCIVLFCWGGMSHLETLDLNYRAQPDYVLYSAFQPFPGTRLYDMCLEKEYLRGGNDYMYHHAGYSLSQPSLSDDEFMDVWKRWEELEAKLDAEARKKEEKSAG